MGKKKTTPIVINDVEYNLEDMTPVTNAINAATTFKG